MNGNVRAVVVAAGRGSRFGRPYNKAFFPLDGISVLSRCLRRLTDAGVFASITVVIARADEMLFEETLAREGTRALASKVVYGGETRSESVRAGLSALPEDTEIVAIHDAARAAVPVSVVRACVDSARQYGSGVPATDVVDTIKRADGENAFETLDRAALCAVQTPQTFRYAELMDAYAHFEGEATDDAAVYEQRFGSCRLVRLPECRENPKLTTPEDIVRFRDTQQLAGDRETSKLTAPEDRIRFRSAETPRVGEGYDAHRLVEGRKLILCGVEFPYEKGLLGHSDADVAAHAAMDALLGAAALGDIGKLFPDSDPAYKGADSLGLMRKVAALLAQNHIRVGNLDVTIVCQRPKLMPRRDEMRRNLADALGVDASCVSVKATTTEGMGFEGEGLGISARAAALVFVQEESVL